MGNIKIQKESGSGQKKKNKKKFSWKALLCFLAFEFVFTAVTGVINVFYGPFNNVKKTIVGTAMQTYTHQYIAKAFLSDEKIKQILNKDTTTTDSNTAEAASNSEKQNLNDIKIENKHDSKIERFDINGKKFDAYILEIKDPTRVKVGYTQKLRKQGQRTSEIAKENGAIAAINGGGFTDKSADGKLWAGTGAYPTGIVISKGQTIYSDIGNNNAQFSVMALDKTGRLLVGNHSVNDLKKEGVVEAISFGPPLILNGKVQRNLEPGVNPRTAIGQKQDGTIIMVAIDGRQGLKVGATLEEIQQIMVEHGAWNAVNLDGGSSTTMYYDGDIINSPCDPLGERAIATAVYVEP
jgi:exopolysaccharide biosynthesis protein